MPEKKQEKLWDQTVRLDPVQFKDLLIALAHVLEEQKKLTSGLTKIEGELKLIRMEVSELKEKIKVKYRSKIQRNIIIWQHQIITII